MASYGYFQLFILQKILPKGGISPFFLRIQEWMNIARSRIGKRADEIGEK